MGRGSLSHPPLTLLVGELPPRRRPALINNCQAARSRNGLASAVIYLDYNATTPIDERVLESMMPAMTDRFWNAASSHAGGRVASDLVEHARDQVADLIGARRSEIVWTSGATEANNLALRGAMDASVRPPKRSRLVTVATEHRAVLDVALWLREQGTGVTVLPVSSDGGIEIGRLQEELEQGDVALVSVMAANNETGAIADLRAIAEVVHEHGALLHTDATQVVGKLPFDVIRTGVDLASLSGHKFYGPKGVGALYAARRVSLKPLLHGGGHERGLRSGTTNVPGVVGLGTAAQISASGAATDEHRQRALVHRIETHLRDNVGDIEVIASSLTRLPNTTMILFDGADSEAVMANAPTVLVSSGSACTSLSPAPSHVLTAMGLDSAAANQCIRFSVGRPTSVDDVDEAVRDITRAVHRVRSFS